MWTLLVYMHFASYWKDPRIHALGNTGFGGALHALVTPVFTFALDIHYGQDVRKFIHSCLPPGSKCVDLGCGVGFSTPAGGVGVDTSLQMLAMAQILNPSATFVQGNAESFGDNMCCDVAILSFLLHECPYHARKLILQNAVRIAKQLVIVVDIHPSFEPPASMLLGEPYLEDYLDHIKTQIDLLSHAIPFSFGTQPNGVHIWAIEVIH